MKIIGISGRKQSGKNTVANYINGDILKSLSMVQDFSISEEGELLIKTSEHYGCFDVTRKDEQFVTYAEKELWPHVKIYHFADYLKKICVDLFDLTPEQVYGNDEQKNTDTKYDMSSREFLQWFGTDVMRKIKDTIWVDHTIKTILSEQSSVAIIPDVRFPNEVDAIHDAGGVVVRLTRDPHESQHPCEVALDMSDYNWDTFDSIIYNQDSTIEDLCKKLESLNWIWR